MEDYQSNSKRAKETPKAKTPEKKVEKVVVGEVVVQKKSIGRKFKDIFIEADLKSVLHYVGTDVLLPAARNMIVDSATKGVERMMFGESASRRRVYGPGGGPRVTYNSPIRRNHPGITDVRPQSPNRASSRRSREDFILSSREEADLVLERMNDILDTYEVASMADLLDLVGLPTSHTDNKWGWVYLGDASVRQVREGYLLELPPAEPIT